VYETALLSFDAEMSKCWLHQILCRVDFSPCNSISDRACAKDVVAASQTPFIVVTCTIIERVVCPNVLALKSTLQHARCTVLSFLVKFVIFTGAAVRISVLGAVRPTTFPIGQT
jgi:hypothetical protein